jgi:PTS system ascorbate-specific IIB component
MTFLAVCSFGVGSSLILKLSLDKAMAQLGIRGEALNIDISSARGTACSAVFTSPEIADQLRAELHVPVYGIRRYMDVAEVTAAAKQYLDEYGKES